MELASKSLNKHLVTKSMNILEENMGKKLYDIGLGNDFLEVVPKAQKQKQI